MISKKTLLKNSNKIIEKYSKQIDNSANLRELQIIEDNIENDIKETWSWQSQANAKLDIGKELHKDIEEAIANTASNIVLSSLLTRIKNYGVKDSLTDLYRRSVVLKYLKDFNEELQNSLKTEHKIKNTDLILDNLPLPQLLIKIQARKKELEWIHGFIK